MTSALLRSALQLARRVGPVGQALVLLVLLLALLYALVLRPQIDSLGAQLDSQQVQVQQLTEELASCRKDSAQLLADTLARLLPPFPSLLPSLLGGD